MATLQKPWRFNVAELKDQIIKKIGKERAQRYFFLLSRFLGSKLSKSEFDKLCQLTLGRENVSLHNKLISSILKNASQATVPPTIYPRKIVKYKGIEKKKSPLNGDQKIDSVPPAWTNGGTSLPQKVGVERKNGDRRSPLGPNQKTEIETPQLVTIGDTSLNHVVENGVSNQFDEERIFPNRLAKKEPQIDDCMNIHRVHKKPRIKTSPNPLQTSGECLLPATNFVPIENAILAPLGVPFCSASIGGSTRPLPLLKGGSFASFMDSDELPDSNTLRERMQQLVQAEGLDEVSMDCANLLNNGLDAYLKRLIRTCVDLVGVRSGYESIRHSIPKAKTQIKPINGFLPGKEVHMQDNYPELMEVEKPQGSSSISLMDFKVAMELSPQQLGEDAPLLLERICTYVYDE